MKTDLDRVRAYYSRFGEWERLDSPAGALEFRRACALLDAHLPTGARILDLGGGPGRYSIHFARRGHRVVLADLSATLLEAARRSFVEAGVTDNIDSIDEADAQNLARYSDERFDAVAAFGPFHHLLSGPAGRRASEIWYSPRDMVGLQASPRPRPSRPDLSAERQGRWAGKKMSFTSQDAFDVRCEWGPQAVAALRDCRTFVVVDVLSFSTCVAVAAARGVQVVPCRFRDTEAVALADRLQASLAGPRGGGYSLSPASLVSAPRGMLLVLPSPNGATVCLEAAARGRVLAGCLRNRSAVARRAAELGGPFGIIPAGERWADGTLRPSYEDLVAAGAIAAELPGTLSSEAAAAVAVFKAASSRLRDSLLSCSSGRELVERGFSEDVLMAAELDVEALAPELMEGRFVCPAAEAAPPNQAVAAEGLSPPCGGSTRGQGRSGRIDAPTRRADAAASPRGERLTERHLHLSPWGEVAAVCGSG
jgi:2-phosphosulfolactate phosphatase